ncbi:hypothetical protein FGG08_000346 [Glutinoglossum americanum]|uniref:Uncharacterized protein n=1 Tax=Glutinoglossum americanum TaxID=1670608 RepID=A0A9P8L3U0_9PEZI|nr:hypothetical protein FGG08_000346 [Glutinoglossum americanum]
MSSSAPGDSAPGGSDNPDGKKKGIGKYVTRVKTILRSDKKRQSISGISAISASSALASPTTATAPEPSSKPTPTAPPATTSTAAAPAPKTATTSKAKTGTTRDPLNQERARALFQKYGINLEPNEWPLSSREPGERVEKPIRMRIHRTCHRCQNTFGVEKTCSHCGHNRCKKCPRYPLKKSAKGKEKDVTAAGLGPEGKTKPKYQLTMPSKTGGQDRVRKTIRQRVHRKCHKCDVEFHRSEKLCVGCGHIRCKKCPRDPPKLKKYPDGYPGDAEPEPERPERTFKKVRRRVRWYCHSCQGLFMEGSKTCSNCNHERCPDCTREPPKRIKPPPDPEVVKSVAEKLEAMKLGTYTSPSAGSRA